MGCSASVPTDSTQSSNGAGSGGGAAAGAGTGGGAAAGAGTGGGAAAGAGTGGGAAAGAGTGAGAGGILLYGSVQSTCTQRVLTTLTEKGLKYELKPVNLMTGEHKNPKYIQDLQPFGVIPVLVDENGFKIYESRAICRYLEMKYKGKGTELIPTKDIQAQSLFEQAAQIEVSYFDSNASAIVFERAFKKMLNQGEPNEERVNQLTQQLNDKLDVYEKILSQQPYLAGQTFTLADLFHLPYGSWLVKIGEGDLFNSRPNVKKWWEKITSRSSWKTVQGMT